MRGKTVTDQIEQILAEAEVIEAEKISSLIEHMAFLTASPSSAVRQRFTARISARLDGARVALATIKAERSQYITDCNSS